MAELTAAPSKSRLAYDWIRSRIADGRLPPGTRLVLAAVAGELGVSAVPVREAIRLLEAEGLVTFERNVGAQVALVDEGEYVATMQVLGIAEGAATAISAPWVTADDLDRAAAINARLEAMLADFDPHAFTRLNAEFHAVLFERCPNPQLLAIVRRAWDRLARLRDSTFSFVPERAVESVREHVGILELIRAGAPELDIELTARAHRTRTVDALLAYQTLHRH